MSRDQQNSEVVRQPARGQPIKVPRPPLDWGDEEPDRAWEALYYEGLVNPPYRSAKERKDFRKTFFIENKPIGKPMTNDELMCALGRCQCARCDERDREWMERARHKD